MGFGSAAVVLARIGPSPLAALLLLKELTNVFRSHHLAEKGTRPSHNEDLTAKKDHILIEG